MAQIEAARAASAADMQRALADKEAAHAQYAANMVALNDTGLAQSVMQMPAPDQTTQRVAPIDLPSNPKSRRGAQQQRGSSQSNFQVEVA